MYGQGKCPEGILKMLLNYPAHHPSAFPPEVIGNVVQ